MSDKNIKILRKETYLKAIENSVGSKLFNSLFVEFQDSGKTADILNDGMYSCAFFVSSVLYLLGAMDKSHTTVKGILEICENNQDWLKVKPDNIEPGDLIFWEKIKFDDGSENAHVGFALSNQEAVSTDYKNKAVARHPIISDNKRAIEAVYRYTWPDVAREAVV